MRLKVLYTFDHENKTNCLARWPQNIDIRTAYLDQNTQIGVIELKTCIQAIVAASPELVAKLGQDYTVYAYDYSEYDTPLVGQGMLSWVLASSSSTPAAPAHQSKTIVTGRVCKNIMGLFSNTTQETLEVKLRLVPVPTCLQSEYIESMKSYRALSRVIPEGFDAQAWTNFLQANPGITQLMAQGRSGSPTLAAGQNIEASIGHVQRLMHENHASTDQADQNHPSQSDSYPAAEAIEHLPRPASQASSVRSVAPPKRGRGRPPKPVSELSQRMRKRRQTQASRRGSFDMGYGSNDDQQDETHAKKRAKVTKTDYPGPSGFGKQPELRVAASTAASVRIHQPTAIRPSGPTASSLEGPPREPTPVAGPSNMSSRPPLPPKKSGLRCESFVVEETPYQSPYPPSDAGKVPDSETTSPEGSRAESANTPAEFTSSPPVYPGFGTAPSSPRLPTLPRETDSGFMSGTIDDLFEDDEYRPLDDEDFDVASQYIKRPQFTRPPLTGMIISQDSGIGTPIDQTQKSSTSNGQASTNPRTLATTAPNHTLSSHTASSGNLVSSPAFSSGAVRPSLLRRSQTWSGQDNHPSSDALLASEQNEPRSKGRKARSGSGAKRKEAIQSKLAASVANGEMPPFCENCGAIETPTWRKAWIKVHSGTPEHVVISEEEGGVLAWQSLQTDANGQVCLFRIIKRTLLPEDEGFTECLLCNPCGIWLHTRKCMRPKEVWDKPQGPDGGAGGTRKRSSQPKKGTSSSLLQESLTEDPSGSTAFFPDGSSPAHADDQFHHDQAPQLPASTRPRASSLQFGGSHVDRPGLNRSSAATALQRAIQSSPVHPPSIQRIDAGGNDLTPKPTRRILFPSPTQSTQRQAAQGKSDAIGSMKPYTSQISESADKENLPPRRENEQQCTHDPPLQRSVTPSSKSRDMRFKTPKRSMTPDRVPPTTGDFFSSAAKALLRPHSTPKHSSTRPSMPQPLGEVSPFTAQINAILSDNNVSPTHSNFDFPYLPSLHNTPGRVRHDFDFSQFDPQDLISTDGPMASSPPVGNWFGIYEDPGEKEGDWWSQYGFPGSSPPTTLSEKAKAKAALSVDEDGHARVEIASVSKDG
ncbi:MAG: hypothetical protein Q9201_003617 [Fulgogasparrea decipioides]